MNDNSEVCLVSVFNFKYERNLEPLDRIYGERFRNRLHLMPFYTGVRPDVVNVYESSYFFEGYFAQAHAALSRKRCKHYVFCADDLLLHPSLNDTNIIEALGLSPRAAYIKSIASLDQGPPAWPYIPIFRWEHTMPALANLADKRGMDFRAELPTYEDAVHRFQQHGLGPGEFRWEQLRARWQVRSYFLAIFYLYKRLQFLRRRRKQQRDPGDSLRAFPYPLAKGYADFFVLPGEKLDEFCRICGVLAAMDVFVEIAVATALVLCCDEIVQESQTRWRGDAYWSVVEARHLAEQHDYDYATLAARFPDDRLYVHPIKLSQWKV